MSNAEATVLVERRGAVAVITLNRPERRNGVTVPMCHAFYDAVCEVAASDARVTVLRGAGNDFSVGADISEIAPAPDARSPGLEELGQIHHASAILYHAPQVSIAAIDGGCAGAGIGWAAGCDFRMATPEARLSTAFLKVGVPGDMGLAWALARIVGGARARELLFFPEKLTGEEALEIGLVTRLYPRETLHENVLALADELCAREPFALRMMKANMVSAEALPFDDYISLETARQLHVTGRPGFVAAMAESFRKSRSGARP